MLETLEDPDVRHMSIETPEQQPDALFDAERDILPEDWEQIKEYIRRRAKDPETSSMEMDMYLDAMSRLKRIDPQFEVSQDLLLFKAEIKQIYSAYNVQFQSMPEIKNISSAKELYPELIINGLEEYKKSWAKAISKWNKAIWYAYAEYAPALLKLGLTPGDIGLDEKKYLLMQELLAELEGLGNGVMYATIGAGIRNLWPQKPFQVSEIMATAMQAELQRAREERDWNGFLTCAACMQELNPSTPMGLTPPAEQIPDTRNF